MNSQMLLMLYMMGYFKTGTSGTGSTTDIMSNPLMLMMLMGGGGSGMSLKNMLLFLFLGMPMEQALMFSMLGSGGRRYRRSYRRGRLGSRMAYNSGYLKGLSAGLVKA